MGGKLMIQHNDVTELFEDYVPSIEKSMNRMLVFEMIKSDLTLENLIENLIAGVDIYSKFDTGGNTSTGKRRMSANQRFEKSPMRSNSPLGPSAFNSGMPSYDVTGRKSRKSLGMAGKRGTSPTLRLTNDEDPRNRY